jgi:hypothetical protein
VRYVSYDPKVDRDGPPLDDQRYIPDTVQRGPRVCARKGINPLGSENQLYVHDQEIVEEYLKMCYYLKHDVYEKIRTSPWHNREWVLHMCRVLPATASFLLEVNGDLQLEIIEAVPRDYVPARSKEALTLLTSGSGGLQCVANHASSSWLVLGVKCSARTSRC